METPRYPSLWHNRDFMLLWSGQLLSSVGSQVSLLAFPLLVLGITHSATKAGLVGALDSLPFALLCLPAGAFIDRWDRKRVMLICDTGRALALGSIPVALWLGRLSLLQLCLIALVEGTLMTFFSVAEIACLPHVVSKEQIPAASAQNQAINSTAWTLGPFLGGLLYGVGHAVPFLKRLTKPGMGFFSFETAWRTLQGFEVMNMMRKGDVKSQVALVAKLFGVGCLA